MLSKNTGTSGGMARDIPRYADVGKDAKGITVLGVLPMSLSAWALV
jgi:hypothetical protein